jgi:hypothetical protein
MKGRYSSGSIHIELEKVNFPDLMGAMDSLAAEEWLENMVILFTLWD